MNKVVDIILTNNSPSKANDSRPLSVRERKEVPHPRLPKWIKVQPKTSEKFFEVRSILKANSLHTVCQEAACPNINECFGEGTATFMILGKHCTRGCTFCDVLRGKPATVDYEEPRRLAEVVAKLNLKQVVITCVTRDDLPDGGASIFVDTMRELRLRDKTVKVEFLISDLAGNKEALDTIITSGVDVLGHNVETVRRLHKRVRGTATLDRSLDMLRHIAKHPKRPVVKTGFMVGFGETMEECVELLHQIYAAGVEIVTVGQYLRPSLSHLPVANFFTPEQFAELGEIGKKIGFAHIESGPLVRSSYKAFTQSEGVLKNR